MINQEKLIEIFSRSWEIDGGIRTRSVAINYTKEWDIRIEEYLTGGDLEETYGDWDHEEFIIIKRLDAPMLMALIFKYAFNQSSPLTFPKLKLLLQENGMRFEHEMWS